MVRRPWLPRFFALALLLGPPAFAGETGPARLVADLAPESVEALGLRESTGFQRVGSRSVFSSYSSLWVTDGTAEGTKVVAVLCPACWSVEPLGSTGSVAFYSTGIYNRVIWRTDGTPAGTYPIKRELTPVPGWSDRLLASLDGSFLFFAVQSSRSHLELWSSDGSVAGTRPIGSIVPGGQILSLQAAADRAFLIVQEPDGRTALWLASRTGLDRLRETPDARWMNVQGGRAFFVARAGGFEVWTSDGTSTGTRPVTSFVPEDPFLNARLFRSLPSGRTYFEVDDGVHGLELWHVGAQPGSQRRLTDYTHEPLFYREIAEIGRRIVFTAYDSTAGDRLWTSTGDLESTAPLTGCPDGCPSPVSELAAVAPGLLVFYSYDYHSYDQNKEGIWVTDGTAAGTRLLGRSERRLSLGQAISASGRALFELAEEYEDGELWVSDGTVAGTFFVTQGGRGWSHYYGWRGELAGGVANGQLVFPGRAGTEGNAEVLWRSDGSPFGSRPLTDPHLARSSWLHNLIPLHDGLLVRTILDNTGELWFVPQAGGGAPTRLLSLPLDDDETSDAVPVVVLGDAAVFLRFGDEVSVWKTDGTPQGTAELLPASNGSRPRALVRWGEKAAIWISTPSGTTFRSELWLTDGTPQGTRKRLELPLGTEMHGLTAAAGKLWFFDRVGRGREILLQPWVSDGTAAGTRRLTRAAGHISDPLCSDPDCFDPAVCFDPAPFQAAGRVYFRFGEAGSPSAIWVMDGTPAGTRPAVTPASGAAAPLSLSTAGGRLFFAAPRARGSVTRVLPWVSDGTDRGTALLTRAEIDLDPYEYPPQFTEMDGRVYFAASDAQHGEELWSTDGTPEGTSRLLEIAPGLLDANPQELTVWNGRLYFRARDAVHGMELWTSDGTAEGTRMIQDIAPGASWSEPANLTATEQGLYFSAHDDAHGRELWMLPPGAFDP